MANQKISELTAATTPLAGTETAVVVQGGVTKKVAVSALAGTIAAPVTITGVGSISHRTLNGDDNSLLVLGSGQAITDVANDVYMGTITPSPGTVSSSGAAARGVGVNIGQWAVTFTDAQPNRTSPWCNIEADFIQFQQTGGATIVDKAQNTRFRFAIPKTGVTITKNIGIDFVVPNVSDVTGAVTDYIAINIPALTGGGGTNFYGILFNNAPNGGSIAAAVGVDLNLNIVGPNNINLKAAGTTVLNIQAGSGTLTGQFSVTGVVVVGQNTGGTSIQLNGAAGNSRSLLWKTAGNNRWQIHADSAAEGGANAGSDLTLQGYADNGSIFATPYLVVRRSDGRFLFYDGVHHAFGVTTGSKIGTATTQKIGFWNATPVVQPSGTPAAATDLATAIALVNSLRTSLLATGLVA